MLAEIRGCVEAAAREKKTLVASLAASAVVGSNEFQTDGQKLFQKLNNWSKNYHCWVAIRIKRQLSDERLVLKSKWIECGKYCDKEHTFYKSDLQC